MPANRFFRDGGHPKGHPERYDYAEGSPDGTDPFPDSNSGGHHKSEHHGDGKSANRILRRDRESVEPDGLREADETFRNRPGRICGASSRGAGTAPGLRYGRGNRRIGMRGDAGAGKGWNCHLLHQYQRIQGTDDSEPGQHYHAASGLCAGVREAAAVTNEYIRQMRR